MIALACTIERKRKDYYAAPERNNRDLEIIDWLTYFARTVLDAQDNTSKRADFYVAKAKFYERFRGSLNKRQENVIARMFREGVEGFKGGLSAENYITIAQTSRATATRDLQDLVAKGVLTRTGSASIRATGWTLHDDQAPIPKRARWAMERAVCLDIEGLRTVTRKEVGEWLKQPSKRPGSTPFVRSRLRPADACCYQGVVRRDRPVLEFSSQGR